MKRTENECVNCGLPCLGMGCPYANVTRFYCDKCGEEEQLYYFNDGEYCLNCIEEKLEKVN